MASANFYQAGLGASSGDRLVTTSGAYLINAARAWYVHYGTGTDAASPAGRQREKPLKTLGQAYTNASASDIIVLLSGHAETIAVALNIGKANVIVVGEGTGTSRPRLTCGIADVMLDFTQPGTQCRNIYFPASTVAPVGARVQARNTSVHFKDCYFECGALDTVSTLRLAAGSAQCRLAGCSFVVTASQPSVGFEAAVAQTNLDVIDCIFDGGTYGFSDYAFKASAAVTGLRAEGNSMLNNADLIVATGSTGYWIPGSGSGSALLEFTA